MSSELLCPAVFSDRESPEDTAVPGHGSPEGSQDTEALTKEL